MVNAGPGEMARPSHNSVHRVALFQKQFGQIRAILTGYPGNQRDFVGICHLCQILGPNIFFSSATEI
jgi:hypothetical protein